MTTSLTIAPSTKTTFGLAWPLAVNAILLHSIIILDTYLVSTLGEVALAAMGVAAAISGLLLGALVALSNATQIIIAQAKGADDKIGLKSAFWCAAAMGLCVALVGFVGIFSGGRALIDWVSPSFEVASHALNYLKIFTLVILFEAGSQAISCLFNGTGRTKIPFYSHIVEMPVNVLVSVLFIFGLAGFPALGLSGAAIGSVAAAFFRLVFLIIYLYRFDFSLVTTPGWAKQQFWPSIKWQLVFALPVAATFFGQAACNTVSSLLYARMSIHHFAAMTLILPWVQVVGMMVNAWAQATGILVGQLLGASATDLTINQFLKRAWRVALGLSSVVSVLYLVASLLFPWIYSGLEAATLAALWSFVPALLLIPFAKVSNSMCGNVLRAGGDTVYVMNTHLASQWLYRVPLIALFVLYLDLSVTWVFALLLFEELIKFPFFHKRFFDGHWRTMLSASLSKEQNTVQS